MDFLVLIIFVLLLVLAVLAVVFVIRHVIWRFAFLFHFIDELMWFLYNPFRLWMKGHQKAAPRVWWVLATYLLIKPVWQVMIFFATFPLRVITTIYADVLVYLSVMASDTIEELFNPKIGKIRRTKGLKYLFFYIAFLPYRILWFCIKNALALVDSALMVAVSLGFPTFTMYHGTKAEHSQDIAQKGRWLVGTGNYAGTGIYFGRKIKVVKHYGSNIYIAARVTFSLVRNCGTLPSEARDNVGLGEKGSRLAKQVKFPYVATELWRSGTNWWEYCLLQPGKEGKFISSWRIRPIGTVQVKGEAEFGGKLNRLWGGQSHYCLRLSNIIMSLVGALSTLLNMYIWLQILA